MLERSTTRNARTFTARAAALAALSIGSAGCSTAPPEHAPIALADDGTPAAFELTARDFERPWILLPVPKQGSSLEGLTRGSDGRFFALLRESRSIQPNGGKSIGVVFTNRLASSTDGVAWTSEVVDQGGRMWRDVVSGGGHTWMVGGTGSAGLLRHHDGATWTDAAWPRPIHSVSFVNGRFIALGLTGVLLVSEDGSTWQDRSQKTALNTDVAFGDGHYLVTGNTDFFLSTDAVTWERVSPTCTDAATCPGTTPPGWQPGQPVSLGVSGAPFIGAGKFWAGQYHSSDGRTWQVGESWAIHPEARLGGLFLRVSDTAVAGSPDGETWSLSTALTLDNPGGMSCVDHPCYVPPHERFVILIPRQRR